MTPYLPSSPADLPSNDPYITLLCNDYEAAEALAWWRWGGQFSCRRCKGDRATHLRCRPRVWECRDCGAFNSVTAGTILHRTRLPLAKIVLAAFLMCRQHSISSNQLRKILGTRYSTAWCLAHRLRHALHQAAEPVPLPFKSHALSLRPRKTKVQAREREAPFVTVFAARHPDTGRMSVATAELDRRAALQRVMDEGVVPRDAEVAPQMEPSAALAGLRTTLRRTHQSVSRRWMDRYVTGWAALQGTEEPFACIMNAAMAHPPRPWRHLRPTDLRQMRTYL